MANEVSVDITSQPLSREENGVVFTVNEVDDEGRAKFGELRVSRGGLRWKPKNHHDHHFMTWKELDDVMRSRPRK